MYMDIYKMKSLDECLSSIQSLSQTCDQKFTPRACANIKQYYLQHCYNKFEKSATCSSVNTFGGNTLNLINKSPSPPSL